MIFKKRILISSGSLSSLAWKKFRKNRLGFGSLVFIGLTVVVACLGYLITPDSTPFANDQYLELGLKKPGFTVTMLPVKINIPATGHNFFKTMVSGKRESFQNIPIRSYSIKNNHIAFIG